MLTVVFARRPEIDYRKVFNHEAVLKSFNEALGYGEKEEEEIDTEMLTEKEIEKLNFMNRLNGFIA